VDVTREVVVPAPPAEVWEALTDPERLEEWFANEVELEPEPGGEGLFRWENGELRRAFVHEVEVERRFAFTWQTDDGDESEVEFTLDEVEDGTRVVVTESTPAPAACAGEWGLAFELRALARSSLALA
jgi:uncharacterized protein YndB with AHSA1/START domain